MADENDEAEKERLADEARRQLEAQQRLDAMFATAASQGQPNAIPAEQPVTAAGRTPSPVGDPANPQGYFIDRGGANLGPTGQLKPPESVGIQGTYKQGDEAFWAANPNGAIKDPQTGNLIGLGDHAVNYSQPTVVNAGLGPPATPYSRQNTVNAGLGPPAIPGAGLGVPAQPFQAVAPRQITPADIYNPKIKAQMDNLDAQIADRFEKLRTASTQKFGKGQSSQHDVIVDELKRLQYSRGILGEEYNRNANQGLAIQTKNLELQKDTDRVNAGSEMVQFISGLPRDPVAREDAWRRELAKPERLGWLEALNHDKINQVVQSTLKENQTAAEKQAAIQAMFPDKQVDIASGGTSTSPKFNIKDQTAADTAQMQEINKALKARGLPFDARAIFNPIGEGHKADKPYEQLGPNDAVQVPYTNNKGDLKTASVSKSTIEALKAEFNEQYKKAGGEFQQPATTPTATPHPRDNAAVQWAKANPDDPRAKRILSLNAQ